MLNEDLLELKKFQATPTTQDLGTSKVLVTRRQGSPSARVTLARGLKDSPGLQTKFAGRVTLLPETTLRLLHFSNLASKARTDNKTGKLFISKAKILQIVIKLDVFGVLFADFSWYCDHILLLGAKIGLPRVGELSLAEHLQGATQVTLALG